MVIGDGENGCASGLSKYEALASSLPASRQGLGSFPYRKYGGFWYPDHLMAPTLAIRDTFIARPSDVILATMPKSGTTWLKALVYTIVHRGRHDPADDDERHHPLLSTSPHELVPFLHSLYETYHHPGRLRLEETSPRVYAVHTPFTALPASVAESGCRVVYLCRDPKDAFVSLRHYLDEIKPEGSAAAMTPFVEAVDLYCDGVSPFGPVWDHMAEYWKESVARPREVMFLRYEQLKEDAVGCVRKLAEFLGCAFTDDEVGSGVPEDVVALCSMDRMRSVQANRDGVHGTGGLSFKNSAFFRKGEVGDWKAHMTPGMGHKIDGVVEEKLRGSGLSLTDN